MYSTTMGGRKHQLTYRIKKTSSSCCFPGTVHVCRCSCGFCCYEREKRAWYTLTVHASNCTRISGHRLFSVYFFSKLLAKGLLAKHLWREISSWARLQKVKASPPV